MLDLFFICKNHLKNKYVYSYSLGIDINVITQKYYQKWRDDIVNSLNVPTSRISDIPDEENSFHDSLHDRISE